LPIPGTASGNAIATSRDGIDMEGVLRQLAVTMADRNSSVKQIMDVLQLWTQLVVARRDSVSHPASATSSGAQPIVDVVQISPVALSRQAS
jgi:hypothetical protein